MPERRETQVFAKSRGKYVVFWDADDRFALDALEKLYTKAEADEADLCVCDIRKWDDTTDRYVLPSNYLRKEFYAGKSAVFKRRYSAVYF